MHHHIFLTGDSGLSFSSLSGMPNFLLRVVLLLETFVFNIGSGGCRFSFIRRRYSVMG